MIPAAQKAHDEVHSLTKVRAGLNELYKLAEYAPDVRKVIAETRRSLDMVSLDVMDVIIGMEQDCKKCEYRRKCGDPMA